MCSLCDAGLLQSNELFKNSIKHPFDDKLFMGAWRIRIWSIVIHIVSWKHFKESKYDETQFYVSRYSR